MAVTISVVRAGSNLHIADVEATADGDTTATIPHGIVDQEGAGIAPEVVLIAPLATGPFYLSEWEVTTINATNVVLTKTTAVGSGAAGDQLRCVIMRPHSIIQ